VKYCPSADLTSSATNIGERVEVLTKNASSELLVNRIYQLSHWCWRMAKIEAGAKKKQD